MIDIPLTRGQVAMVDDADFAIVGSVKWYADYNAHTKSFYAKREVKVAGVKKTLQMHRLILGLISFENEQDDALVQMLFSGAIP